VLLPKYSNQLDQQLTTLQNMMSDAMTAEEGQLGYVVRAAPRGQFQNALNKECVLPASPPPGKTTPPWPFDAATFLVAFSRAAREAGPLQASRVDVGVIDSGYPFVPTGILADARLSVKEGNASFDRYGINGSLPNTAPFAQPEDPDSNHGTEVATLALGGKSFLDADSGGVSRIRLRLERVIDPNVVGGITQDAMIASLDDAIQNHASIVNMSIEFPMPLQRLIEHMAQYPNILVVAAAGNDARDPQNVPRYPANYGGFQGILRGQILTVGASAQDGSLAPFSAKGWNFVDVLAPGCDVPTLDLSLAPTSDLGTSLSAPLVTFFASLAHQLGLNGPDRLRERVIASTDVSNSLYLVAFAAGILNPYKLLQVHHDYIETVDGSAPLVGTISWDVMTQLPICLDWAGSPDWNSRLVKLARLTGSPDWLVIWRTASGQLQRCRANLDETQSITFISGDSSMPIKFTAIKDIVSNSDDGS
jgi:hypothetical protein